MQLACFLHRLIKNSHYILRGVYYTYNYDTAEYEVYVDHNKAPVISNKRSKKARSAKKYDTKTKMEPNNEDKDCHGHYKLSRKEGRKRASSVDSAVPTNPNDSNVKNVMYGNSISAPPSPQVTFEFDKGNNSSQDKFRKARCLEDLEDGEISSDNESSRSLSGSEYEKYNLEAISETEENDSKENYNPGDEHQLSTIDLPPCVRLMIIGNCSSPKNQAEEESSSTTKDPHGQNNDDIDRLVMKKGTLFIITCTGGSIGREGNHHVVLLDREIGCSKEHATITFHDGKFHLVDRGSTNGTFLNTKRLVKNKPAEIGHGSLIRIGTTTMKCHVHPGKETCFECEPGVIGNTSINTTYQKHQFMSKSKKEKLRKKEMKRIKAKYGVLRSDTHLNDGDKSTYKDRAEERRIEKGSDNPFEATQSASLDVALDNTNKGFKMLSKMGWKEGEGLGVENNQGRLEPIKIESREERSGLGSNNVYPPKPYSNFKIRNKQEAMKQIRERFENMKSNLEQCDSDNEGNDTSNDK